MLVTFVGYVPSHDREKKFLAQIESLIMQINFSKEIP